MAPRRTALVVGGAGFLGQHIVRQLLASGRYDVRVFDIRPSAEAAATSVVGDIRKLQDVLGACAAVDVVVHVATATPTSENALNKALMDDVNVKGTGHVVEACRQLGIRALVYTSSASGARALAGRAALRTGCAWVACCQRAQQCMHAHAGSGTR